MVRNLVGGYEANAKAPDVLASREFPAAANVRDAVVIAAVAVLGDEAAGPRIQVATVGELTAVTHQQAAISDVEYDLLGLGVIRILDELKGHDVVALEAS